jgi:hypothetical protein
MSSAPLKLQEAVPHKLRSLDFNEAWLHKRASNDPITSAVQLPKF